MRIAHINLSRELRGGEMQTAALVEALARTDDDKPPEQTIVLRRGSRFHAYCTRLLDSASRPVGVSLKAVRPNTVAATLAAKDVDLVHVHEGRSTKVGAVLSVMGKPVVVTRRISKRPKNNALTRWVYSRADAVACVSTHIEQVMAGYVDPARVCGVHDCVRFTGTRNPRIRSAAQGSLRVASIGAMRFRDKGQDLVAGAARRMADTGANVQFVVAGDGEDQQELREMTAGLCNIEILGWVDDIPGLLDSCDVLLHPARNEGLGSVLVEALSVGVPVIATRVGGIPDVIVDGTNGILLAEGSVDCIADALESLLRSPGMLERLSQHAAESAGQFSAERMAGAYLRIYRKVQ